jgi:hypothetical protein
MGFQDAKRFADEGPWAHERRRMSSARRSIARGCVVAALLAAAVAQAHAQESKPEHQSWWWSWGDGSFGMNFGGISYGDGKDRIIGSDKLVHEVRPVSGVKAIELRGPVNVVLKQSAVEKLTVHTDDNLTGVVETTVDDGVLRVGIKDGVSFRSRHAIGVTVELAHLDAVTILSSGDLTGSDFQTDLLRVTVRGSGDVHLDSLRAGTVAVLIQGSGDVRLSGSAPQQGYVIEGSGDVDASELVGRNVAVRIAGSGDADVWATDSLSVDINGSGDVAYRGNASVKKSINGSGDLTHR